MVTRDKNGELLDYWVDKLHMHNWEPVDNQNDIVFIVMFISEMGSLKMIAGAYLLKKRNYPTIISKQVIFILFIINIIRER